MICKDDLTIGILAGGKATRMGNSDKGLINVGGTPFVEILINKIIPHSKDIIINGIAGNSAAGNRNILSIDYFILIIFDHIICLLVHF